MRWSFSEDRAGCKMRWYSYMFLAKTDYEYADRTSTQCNLPAHCKLPSAASLTHSIAFTSSELLMPLTHYRSTFKPQPRCRCRAFCVARARRETGNTHLQLVGATQPITSRAVWTLLLASWGSRVLGNGTDHHGRIYTRRVTRYFFIAYLCTPPWCGASAEKSFWLWHHFS